MDNRISSEASHFAQQQVVTSIKRGIGSQASQSEIRLALDAECVADVVALQDQIGIERWLEQRLEALAPMRIMREQLLI